ncbi:MAG TPA: sugar transferase [Candidatus Woesebacteria bacterium]|nr:sugar transferase [Candidatus Woesebacteria bacterium]HPJ17038.1 sugar transferase [Candidatus Woesebacteria bacterium]
MTKNNQLFFIFKRLVDIVSSITLLILFSPIMLITAVLIKITSPGPVIFKQKRVGRNQTFLMYKFRSMYIGDNDEFLKTKYPELWEKYKKLDWKLPMNEDPRITKIGKYIRAASIDEMPQFINVLKGEMSLVGPRAYRDEELKENYQKYPQARKHIDIIRTAKPGITGLWQVSGRNDVNFQQRAELDAKYISQQSIVQDILIIFKTPFAMISRW